MSDDEDENYNVEEVMIDDSLLVTNVTADSLGLTAQTQDQPSTSGLAKKKKEDTGFLPGISNMEPTLQYLSGLRLHIIVNHVYCKY